MPDDSGHPFGFVVEAAAVGSRLDRFLSAQEIPYTRSQLKRHLDTGRVSVNGKVVRPAYLVRIGDIVSYTPPGLVSSDVVPENIPLNILYEDRDLIVIDKAAGMVVHPAPGHRHGTLVAALLGHCEHLSGIGGVQRPGIVHRLDKLTSGIMVAAKRDHAHQGLVRQFQAHSIERSYLAIARGIPNVSFGTFRGCHARHPVDRKRFTCQAKRGREAITHYQVKEVFAEASLIEARLETGRTHQVRVHFSENGHPLLGDPVYGQKVRTKVSKEIGQRIARQALHAWRLAFVHPITGAQMSFSSDLPADMQYALARLRQT